jgi:antitoxin YefM
MIKNVISISEARKNIFQIANEVQKPDNYYTLTENGRPKIVIISADEFESWLETVEVLNSPEIMREIADTKRAYIAKDFVPLSVYDNKSKYVQSSTKKRSGKKSK